MNLSSCLVSHKITVCEVALREAGITHTRLDGTMKQQDRSRVVADFMQDEDCHVLLASTRAAGLGLNLTRATRVIFMYVFNSKHLSFFSRISRDRWWNPAVEDQVSYKILQQFVFMN